MQKLTPSLRKQLSRIRLQVLPEDYYVVHLPPDEKAAPAEWYRPATTRFAVFIRDAETVTLIVPRRKWLRMQNLFPKFRVVDVVKVVTLGIGRSKKLEPCLAAIGRVLAEAEVGAAPLSSFHRDHILVPKQNLPRAVRVLRQFLALNC
jgi:hypothetical protein